MGGNIAWTIRLSDGTDYRMDRWTNSISHLITNPLFIEEDPAHINECIASWNAMKSDWEANKDTGEYDLPMTGNYAPYPYGLKPSEYGLVVTDFETKTILTNQSYCSFDQFDMSWLNRDTVESFKRHLPERYESLMSFSKKDMIKGYIMLFPNNPVAQQICSAFPNATVRPTGNDKLVSVYVEGPMELDAFKEILDGIAPYMRDSIIASTILLDFAPFTIEEYEPTADGWTRMLARVKELNFFLSFEEEKEWSARIKYAETHN